LNGFGRGRNRESHIHVFDVHDGKATSPTNRRVIFVHLGRASVETRDVRAVKEFKGEVVNVELVGNVTVPIAGHLDLVERWIKKSIRETKGEQSVEVILDGIRARIAECGASVMEDMRETITLEIFEGIVLNYTKEKVFGPVKDPSSSL
jgi:hypothetical protein